VILGLDGNSQVGATVIEHAPVPRWGWGEASHHRSKGAQMPLIQVKLLEGVFDAPVNQAIRPGRG
jgi:hypothetical protein